MEEEQKRLEVETLVKGLRNKWKLPPEDLVEKYTSQGYLRSQVILALRKYPSPSQEMETLNYLLDTSFSENELEAAEADQLGFVNEQKVLGMAPSS